MTVKTTVLRDYQAADVRKVAQLFAAGHNRVLMREETGAGKTRMAGYIAARFMGLIEAPGSEPGRSVLWCVPKKELLLQASMVFAENGIPHQIVAQKGEINAIRVQQFKEFGRTYIESGALLTLGMIQTLDRRLGKLHLDPDLIITDEAHMSLNETHRRVIDSLMLGRDARLRADLGGGDAVVLPVKRRTKLIGLTATPWRMDGRPFHVKDGGLYEQMVDGISMAELIAIGHLSKFEAYWPKIELVKGVQLDVGEDGDYIPAQLDAELSSPKVFGDVIAHYERLSKGKPAIGFCPTTKKAEEFAQAFRDAGYRAVSLDASTDDVVRRESLQQLARGELDVVMSCEILVAGVDVPYATTALLLCKTKSLTKYRQSVGRVLRPHPLKGFAIILDFVGVVYDHGLPDEVYEWSLDSPPKRVRVAANDEDGGELAAVACPECRHYHRPAKVCPHCGYVHPVKERRAAEQVDTELVKIDRELAEQMRRHRRMMQAQAKSEEELVAMGMNRFRARAIVKARVEKDRMRATIFDLVEAIRRDARCSFYEAAGSPLGEVMKMKPKALAELLATLKTKAATIKAA